MEVYNYKCLDCGNIFEVKIADQKKDENEKLVCLKCQSKNIEQDFSAGCCSDGDVCDITCKPDEDESEKCSCGGNC